MPDDEKKEPEITSFEDAGDAAFAKLNTPEPVKEEPAPEAPKPDSEKPPVAGEDDTLSWVKSLDQQTLKDLREGKLIPKYRFDESTQRMKAYESFGSPEELSARLKAPAAPPPPAPKADQEETLTDEEKEFKALTLKMFPFLKDVPKSQEEFNKLQGEFNKARESEQNARKVERESLIKSGESKIKALCEAEGLPIDGKNLNLHIGAITEILHDEENKELAEKFYKERNVDVLKTVFDDYFKRFFSGFQRKAKVDILKSSDNKGNLPKAPVKGGKPEGESKKTLTKEEALETIGQRWKASGAA